MSGFHKLTQIVRYTENNRLNDTDIAPLIPCVVKTQTLYLCHRGFIVVAIFYLHGQILNS